MSLWCDFRRWRERRYWAQSDATNRLHRAWSYLYREYWAQASSQTRGYVLPDTQEALDLLQKLAKESLDRQCEL